MKILFDGAKEFSKTDFKNNQELYQRLGSGQNPHTLFIGCSDSRVVPDLITKSLPGDLFVVRNIANIVPYYRASSEYLSTTSSIEYALLVLNVENIIICGHSNCGGCKALFLDETELNRIPHTKKWLELAKNARAKAESLKKIDNHNDLEGLVEKENIIEQLKHIRTYPLVEDRYSKGLLNIYGWYYDIGTGKVYNYNFKTKLFDKIE